GPRAIAADTIALRDNHAGANLRCKPRGDEPAGAPTDDGEIEVGLRHYRMSVVGHGFFYNSAAMTLIERTSKVVPLLRRNAEQAEKARHVPQDSLDALGEAGVFRMMAPKKFGGEQADFHTQCRVL